LEEEVEEDAQKENEEQAVERRTGQEGEGACSLVQPNQREGERNDSRSSKIEIWKLGSPV